MKERRIILLLDEDDTTDGKMSLKEFLEIIEQHRKNVKIDAENIFVTLTTEEEEDSYHGPISIGEIQFWAKQ